MAACAVQMLHIIIIIIYILYRWMHVLVLLNNKICKTILCCQDIFVLFQILEVLSDVFRTGIHLIIVQLACV